MTPDPFDVALLVARALEELGIPYVIGGSIASTLHGEPRTTADVDFALHLLPGQVEPLIAALQDRFYVDRVGLHEALRTQSPCNLIHLGSLVKVDLYVRPDSGIHAQETRRARRVQLGAAPDACARVASPEDTVLQKLVWYRKGGEVSDRQWRDVIGVLKQCASDLELEYLRSWSDELVVRDLLARACSEAGLRLDP